MMKEVKRRKRRGRDRKKKNKEIRKRKRKRGRGEEGGEGKGAVLFFFGNAALLPLNTFRDNKGDVDDHPSFSVPLSSLSIGADSIHRPSFTMDMLHTLRMEGWMDRSKQGGRMHGLCTWCVCGML